MLVKCAAVVLLALAATPLLTTPAAGQVAPVRDEAARVHVLVLGYTGARDIGPNCRKDVIAVKAFLTQAFADRKECLTVHDLTGTAWTPEKVLKFMRELKVGPNENVMVYQS